MQYLKINEDNSRTIFQTKPNWYKSDGSPVDNSWLIEKENMYPVYEPEITEEYSYLLSKPIDEWYLMDSYVEKAVWIVKDNPPSYDDFYQSIYTTKTDKYRQIDEHRLEIKYFIKEKTISEKKSELKNALAHKRWKKETSGINYTSTTSSPSGTFTISTDRESQSKIIGSYISAKEKRFSKKKWKTKQNFVEFTASDMIEIAELLENHVQNCYNNESRILNLLESKETMNELKDIYNNEFNKGWD